MATAFPFTVTVAAEADYCSVPKSLTRVRPDSGGDPVRVEVGVMLIDIFDVDELKESFKADFILSLSWLDPRLSAETLGQAIDDCRIGLSDIWNPNVHLVNRRGAIREGAQDVDITPDGTVRFSERITGEMSTTLDLKEFPFDTQGLRIQIASFEYGPQDVVFAVDEAKTGRIEELFIGGWEVLDNFSDPDVQPFSANTRQHTRLEHTAVVERRSIYFIWKFIVPLSFIAFMASGVFWIDPRAIAPQIGLATASVFSLIAFLISLSELIPRVDYLTRLDELVLSVMLLVFLALGEAIITTRLAMQERYDLAIHIDRVSRWVYFSLFIAVMVAHLV
jgi:hypothetical protein